MVCWRPVPTCFTSRSHKKRLRAKFASFWMPVIPQSKNNRPLLSRPLPKSATARNSRSRSVAAGISYPPRTIRGDRTMQKLLVIDDEEAMRRLLRINLSDSYEVIDTGDPEQGLALAMQN